MKGPTDLRQLLLAYKLGQLSPKDREELDERIICDQDFSDQIAEAAYDVVDDYRAGRLERAERRRVEKAFPRAELQGGSDPGFELAKTPDRRRMRWFPIAIASFACLSMGLLALFIDLHKAQAPAPTSSATPSAEKPGTQPSSATRVAPSGVWFLDAHARFQPVAGGSTPAIGCCAGRNILGARAGPLYASGARAVGGPRWLDSARLHTIGYT